MNEKPISGYDFTLKKEEIKKIFNTPDYQEFKKKQKTTQKRKETIYKFTSIGNSTNTVRALIILNVFFFLLSTYFIPQMFTYFASYNINNPNFGIWQPLTSMFLHGGFIHLALNMFVLWSFGNQTEQVLGLKKFLTLYFFKWYIWWYSLDVSWCWCCSRCFWCSLWISCCLCFYFTRSNCFIVLCNSNENKKSCLWICSIFTCIWIIIID